jgi:hypothetical protein
MNGLGRLALARGDVQLVRSACITLTPVFGVLGYACVCHHTRPMRGTRRKMGLQIRKTEKLAKVLCPQKLHKSHEVSPIRRVFLEK